MYLVRDVNGFLLDVSVGRDIFIIPQTVSDQLLQTYIVLILSFFDMTFFLYSVHFIGKKMCP